jgi:peptidoglycan/xylan/chitin deacetylase (PgdA/CDA1 family)
MDRRCAVPGPLALRAFYAVKPLLPRGAQVAARRVRARRIWRTLGRSAVPPVPSGPLGYRWPDGAGACATVTHDVETEVGQANIPSLIEIEEAFGIRSCWNFVVRRYRVDEALIVRLRDGGHEIGIHGVYHDGKEFSSEGEFRKRLKVMEAAAGPWGAVGFRSPSLLYDRQLLESIPFSWDSSMPAWDPFQPKQGDCMTYLPFALNDHCIELPVTLWQDFTLFEELRMTGIEVWRAQIDFIAAIGGLINVIVHPDYMLSRGRLELYRSLLGYLRRTERLWITTPRQVADWARGAPN